MARVLKARYFPTGDILNANLGSSPSYSWKSIHSSLDVIRKGTHWRVGNGKLIHIWDDKWLLTLSTYKVISPTNAIPQFPMVSSLIDPMTKWWRADMIRATFLPFEADSILKIPKPQPSGRQNYLDREQLRRFHSQKCLPYSLQPVGVKGERRMLKWRSLQTGLEKVMTP